MVRAQALHHLQQTLICMNLLGLSQVPLNLFGRGLTVQSQILQMIDLVNKDGENHQEAAQLFEDLWDDNDHPLD